MENEKIRVGITHGDTNGVGYEVILKTFAEPAMLELCTPIIYGSPKVASYHRKALDLQTNFSIISSGHEARDGRVNLVTCFDEEVKVDFGQPTPEAGKAALKPLDFAMKEYAEGVFDVLVTAPINKKTIQGDGFHFCGHTEYIEEKAGGGQKALMILMKDELRVALVTTHLPIKDVAAAITQQTVEDKICILNRSLKEDFLISSPRIAVLSLNPHAGDDGLLGTEETSQIAPAIEAQSKKGVLCFGPFASDGFFGSGNYERFDAILAMYHDQGLAPFKALVRGEGVNFTAGLPIIRTSPAHGTAFDIAGKNVAHEDSFRQAVYTAIDIVRNRRSYTEAHANPLRKLYSSKRDDSDKLKLDTADDTEL
jgi:4-hydroxythreonine-4-phosphate dehydrogenase